MKSLGRILILGNLFMTTIPNRQARAETPELILGKADDVRNPSESFLLTVEIINSDGASSTFEVKIKGKNRTLVKTLAPVRDRGRNMLMINEDMWAYIPNLKRSVRVALNQKLTGEAAHGDISRMRWSGDYNASLEKDEAKQWVLFLNAKTKGLTYEKIRLWVDKGDFHPQKAEYLTLAGDVLKTATFTDYRRMEGALRPGTLMITDAKRADKSSKILIKDIKKAEFPEAIFNEAALAD